MSAHPDASSSDSAVRPAVTAIAEGVEFAMFEVQSFDGVVLRVHTPFTLTVGEELALRIDSIGRTMARVSGHERSGERELTLLTLIDERKA